MLLEDPSPKDLISPVFGTENNRPSGKAEVLLASGMVNTAAPSVNCTKNEAPLSTTFDWRPVANPLI